MHLKNILLLGFFVFTKTVQAQQNTVSAGGNASGSGGEVLFTLGQIDYINSSGVYGAVNQGVQQPYELFAELPENGISFSLLVFPNPTTDALNLSVDQMVSDMRWGLYDMNGKLIQQGSILTENSVIPMNEIEPSTYFLRVNQQEIILQSFKIIKTGL